VLGTDLAQARLIGLFTGLFTGLLTGPLIGLVAAGTAGTAGKAGVRGVGGGVRSTRSDLTTVRSMYRVMSTIPPTSG
jgi:hypothetical protein